MALGTTDVSSSSENRPNDFMTSLHHRASPFVCRQPGNRLRIYRERKSLNRRMMVSRINARQHVMVGCCLSI